MVLGRSCWTYYGNTVYPNVYMVLLGPSGISRKDTALQRARLALEPADAMVAGPNILNGIVSAEGLADQLDRFTGCYPGLVDSGHRASLKHDSRTRSL